MKFFRNKEIQKECVLELMLTVSVVLGTFLLEKCKIIQVTWNYLEGTVPLYLFVLFLCVVLHGMHLTVTCQRYKKIEELAADIDSLLHEDKNISFEKYEEGELAILENEIQKMTIRIREQQQNLLQDKKYLADSIADISHQIRTPLTSVNLLLSFLSKEDISKEERQRKIREIYELLSRIDWLITSLLKISKLDAGMISLNLEQVSMEALLKESIAPLLIPMELRGQELKLHAVGEFFGDINWTGEAIGNIVKNCMEHTPEGGCIKIEASENTIYREIMITDTGNGISPEDLPHVFERFYKGKDSGDKSFGIGLALARGIIHAQNGTIKAENQSSGGAKFTIRFYK